MPRLGIGLIDIAALLSTSMDIVVLIAIQIINAQEV